MYDFRVFTEPNMSISGMWEEAWGVRGSPGRYMQKEAKKWTSSTSYFPFHDSVVPWDKSSTQTTCITSFHGQMSILNIKPDGGTDSI